MKISFVFNLVILVNNSELGRPLCPNNTDRVLIPPIGIDEDIRCPTPICKTSFDVPWYIGSFSPILGMFIYAMMLLLLILNWSL